MKDRRRVDKLSGGRVGYLHIQAMDQPSLAKFKKELAEFRHKEGLVIDEPWNGGGNIEQELLAILVQRPYEVWQPRGIEPNERPFSGYFGPKVVLQNWRMPSNAEMFPAGFRALGLGKVVGTPTMGAVIGTGSYSLIDGSTIRTPGVGVFLADTARTNMENHAVQPDIYVENSPEDNLAGRDRQLEVAVAEVMKDLKSRESVAKQGSEYFTRGIGFLLPSINATHPSSAPPVRGSCSFSANPPAGGRPSRLHRGGDRPFGRAAPGRLRSTGVEAGRADQCRTPAARRGKIGLGKSCEKKVGRLRSGKFKQSCF